MSSSGRRSLVRTPTWAVSMREIVDGDSSSFSATCSMVRPAPSRRLRKILASRRWRTVGLVPAVDVHLLEPGSLTQFSHRILQGNGGAQLPFSEVVTNLSGVDLHGGGLVRGHHGKTPNGRHPAAYCMMALAYKSLHSVSLKMELAI